MYRLCSKKYLFYAKSNRLSSTVSDTVKKSVTLKKFEDIPGPKSYPVIGTLHTYLPFIGQYDAEALDKNAWKNYNRYGGLVREHPGVRLVHVFDPDLIESVFRQDSRQPSRRSHLAMAEYRKSKPQVYKTGGLLSTNGPEWWRLRSAFQKNFSSPQSAKEHIGKTDRVLKEFVQWIKESQVNHNVDFLEYLNRLNLEVIGLVGFNERFNSFSANEQQSGSITSQVIQAAFGSNSGIMKLDKGFLWKVFNTPLYKKLVKSQEVLEKLSTDILLKNSKCTDNEPDNTERSVLSYFLQEKSVDFKDITGMMVDILMASIDTTAYSMAFALYHLGRNPDVQNKLFSEVKTVLPYKDSKITTETITNAVYVRSTIKETLRLNPVAIGVGRLLDKNIVLRDYLIPKGTVLVTQNMIASRLPCYVANPLSFKPERWLRGTATYESIHPFVSMPFGFGPRTCLARRVAEQNMAITLIRIIREFEVKWKGGELGVKTLLINKPDKPISLSFTVRAH